MVEATKEEAVLLQLKTKHLGKQHSEVSISKVKVVLELGKVKDATQALREENERLANKSVLQLDCKGNNGGRGGTIAMVAIIVVIVVALLAVVFMVVVATVASMMGKMRMRIGLHLGRVVDLLVGLVNMFNEDVMLHLEQGALGADKVLYPIHLFNADKYVIHLLLQAGKHGPLFLSSSLEGHFGSALNGPIFHSSACYPARLTTITKSS
ncbi:hypothetical protein DVH24_004726 [Malus domestica]|uniref:Uncharacterized protein n=1 Tax=Malus domestica TaxID=3750 RepID=A0A498IF86_MALDO|nr:hypothetical protein DVH24_004726 [Malus domestica]